MRSDLDCSFTRQTNNARLLRSVSALTNRFTRTLRDNEHVYSETGAKRPARLASGSTARQVRAGMESKRLDFNL